jgi:hypothetical protein
LRTSSEDWWARAEIMAAENFRKDEEMSKREMAECI